MTKFQKVVFIVAILLLIAASVAVGLYIYSGQLSEKENLLFSVLLTLFSVLISLIISHFYFESSKRSNIEEIRKEYQQNISLYAKKAAEKVDNLSNELQKLSLYLQQAIDDESDSTSEFNVLFMEERIRSSIHIVETLKSINDRSLSDWRGVLPDDELQEQNEIREERENEFINIVQSYKNLNRTSNQMTLMLEDVNSNNNADIHSDIDVINKKIDRLATSIIGTPVKSKVGTLKEEVTGVCPNCDKVIKYRQKPLIASVKRLKCQHCLARLISRWSEAEGFTLSEKPAAAIVDSEARKTLPEQVIQRVKAALPPQPWDKGVSTIIAKELGMMKADYDRAVRELMSRGEIYQQIDGVLYQKVVPASKDKAQPSKKRTKKTATKSTEAAVDKKN